VGSLERHRLRIEAGQKWAAKTGKTDKKLTDCHRSTEDTEVSLPSINIFFAALF